MLTFRVLAPICLVFTVLRNEAAHAEEFTLLIDTGPRWVMPDGVADSFRNFLDEQLSDVTSRTSAYWPELNEDNDFKNVFIQSFFPASPKYKNREFQCSFVRKILNSVQGETHREFALLTQNGRVCIPGDIPAQDWAGWTEQLMRFFWTRPWIRRPTGAISLEGLIIEKVGVKNYRRPGLHIAKNIEFDGYGWGFSRKELSLFDEEPLLSRYAEVIRDYDPNQEGPFTPLGPYVEKLLVDNAYGMAGTFKPGSEIYISRALGPADLIDFLAHEYGHVFHGEQGENISWDSEGKTLKRVDNGVHSEAVAEAFAWMLLRELYGEYPELKYFHVAKLRLFLHDRPEDPHIVGAAALGQVFHSESEGSFSELERFAESLDLLEYLRSHGLSTLRVKEEAQTYEIPVVF